MSDALDPTTAPDGAPAISCKGTGKIWGVGTDRAVEALKDFSLDVGQNEFVVLLGPSGCGKSTLLYLIARARGPHRGHDRRARCDGHGA